MDDFGEFFNSLYVNGIIEPTNQIGFTGITSYALSTPFEIHISMAASDRLRKRYRPDREIGGLLLAEPIKGANGKVLFVDNVNFIKNISSKPESSYLPMGNRQEYMHNYLAGVQRGKYYIPIWFHSHPVQDPNISKSVMSYFELMNSEQDMKIATKEITYEVLRKSLSFPSALVLVTADKELFVGIYGGRIAPTDLRQAVVEILGYQAGDLVMASLKLGFEEGASNWQKLWGILLAIGSAAFAMIDTAGLYTNDPKTVAAINRLALNLQGSLKERRYLGISKKGELHISIPKT